MANPNFSENINYCVRCISVMKFLVCIPPDVPWHTSYVPITYGACIYKYMYILNVEPFQLLSNVLIVV